MSLILPIIPGITWPRDRVIGNFQTNVQTAVSGKENRYINRLQPRYKYSISISGLDANGAWPGLGVNSYQTLVGFYNQCYGGALAFRFTDPDDGVVTTPQIFGAGDGVTTVFQLVRAMGGFIENVFAPTGTPAIYEAGVLKSAGADYNINMLTGAVTFTAAPASNVALTWAGNFSWWCNWDKDSLDLSSFANGVYEVRQASFTTRVF